MISTMALAGVVLVVLGIPEALANGYLQETAANRANELLQRELHIGLTSFSQVTSVATTSTDFDTHADKNEGLESIETGLTVSLLPNGLVKKLVATSHWKDMRGKSMSISLSAFVADFHSTDPADTCDPVLVGDWTHPTQKTFYLTPGNLLPAAFAGSTPVIQGLAMSGSILIATAAMALGKSDPTLFLFDVSSSTNPDYLSSLDNASSTRAGIAEIAADGNILYAANAQEADFSSCSTRPSCSQLQIIDISNRLAPVVLTSFQLATSSEAFATGSGGQSAGKSIFYADGLVYLGIQKTNSDTGTEFNVIDVRDAQKPIWLGGYHVGRTVNHIEVRDGYAYLATDDPSRELIILDVHDPTQPHVASSYDAPGTHSFGFGETLALLNHRNLDASTSVLLGRSYSLHSPGFLIVGPLDASTTPLIGSTTETASIQSILFTAFLAFVLTSTKLEFWNISDSANPQTYATPLPNPAGSTAALNGMTCRNDALYIATTDSQNMSSITVVTGS